MPCECPRINAQSWTDVIPALQTSSFKTDGVKMRAMHRFVQTKSAQCKYSLQLYCSMWCYRQQRSKSFTLLVLFGPMELLGEKNQLPIKVKVSARKERCPVFT